MNVDIRQTFPRNCTRFLRPEDSGKEQYRRVGHRSDLAPTLNKKVIEMRLADIDGLSWICGKR